MKVLLGKTNKTWGKHDGERKESSKGLISDEVSDSDPN